MLLTPCPPALHLPSRPEDVRDYSGELAQARQRQLAWSIYSDVQKEVVYDLLTGVAKEVDDIRNYAVNTVSRLLLRATQVSWASAAH